MEREQYIDRLKEAKNGSGWDFIVIGGGATGLGIAVDAASRGYKTVLLEQILLKPHRAAAQSWFMEVFITCKGDVALVREAL